MIRIVLTVLCLLVVSPQASYAESLWLPQLFADGMVLQSGKPVAIWGKSVAGAEVKVSLAGSTQTVVADDSGRWTLELDPLQSGGPHTLTISAAGEERTLRDVMVGQVWLCSGQSNMAMALKFTENGEAAAAAAADPLLRVVTLVRAQNTTPQETAAMPLQAGSPWLRTQPDTAGNFSAVAYYFGKKLREATGEPVGLIVSSHGGTLIQGWTDAETLAHPDLRVVMDAWEEHVRKLPELIAEYETKKTEWEEASKQPEVEGVRRPRAPAAPIEPGGRNAPAAHYNAMLHPLVPYTVRGVLWYQGESDAGTPEQYAVHFPLFIESIRRHWGDESLPFYFVQLASFGPRDAKKSGFASIREAQRHALTLPNTGMAVTVDIGDPDDIHPKNKKDVGERLARWALAHEHNQPIEFSGPLPLAARHIDNEIVIDLDHAEGLHTRDGAAPASLEVTDASGAFIEVPARIEGTTLVLQLPGPQKPAKVRYGWGASPVANLYNGDGLPASPFELTVE